MEEIASCCILVTLLRGVDMKPIAPNACKSFLRPLALDGCDADVRLAITKTNRLRQRGAASPAFVHPLFRNPVRAFRAAAECGLSPPPQLRPIRSHQRAACSGRHFSHGTLSRRARPSGSIHWPKTGTIARNPPAISRNQKRDGAPSHSIAARAEKGGAS